MVKQHPHGVDERRIVEAIHAAEHGTTGQIRVSLARRLWGDIRRTAERTFVRLKMTHTPERNGVLIFVVPSRRRFAIIGDRGIHEKVGQEFWDRVSGAMSATIKEADLTAGIVHAIREAGKELAAHFPSKGDAENTLPDTVDE